MKHSTLAAALLLAVTSPSFAQSPADHEKHHPDQKEAPATKQPAPSKGQTGMDGSPDMRGMMGGGGGMMNMMSGGKMPMMMQMMGMMRQSNDGMGAMATIDHVEGRIAFLRAELKITDAQNGAWGAFADALRANAKSLGEVRASIMAGGAQQGLVERFALHEKWLTARLQSTREINSALVNLIGTLSDDQKKAADELLGPHMGMVASMQPGQIGSCAMPPTR